jgi:hypothetical protein
MRRVPSPGFADAERVRTDAFTVAHNGGGQARR